MSLVVNIFEEDSSIVSLIPLLLTILLIRWSFEAFFIPESSNLPIIVSLSLIQFSIQNSLTFWDS